MKELFISYAAYNKWANELLLNACLNLTKAQNVHIIQSNFKILFATWLHMWDAESIWWQRLQGHEQILIPSKIFSPSMQEIANGMINQNGQWENFMHELNENKLKESFTYKNLKGILFSNEVWKTIHHVMNHSTYHRGQIVTMLRQLGVAQIPQTDYIAFVRIE